MSPRARLQATNVLCDFGVQRQRQIRHPAAARMRFDQVLLFRDEASEEQRLKAVRAPGSGFAWTLAAWPRATTQQLPYVSAW